MDVPLQKNLCAVTIYNVLFYILLGPGCGSARNPKGRTTCINTVTLASEEQIGDPKHINHPFLLSEKSLSFPSHSSYPDLTGAHSRIDGRRQHIPNHCSSWAVLPETECVFQLINNQNSMNPAFLILWLLGFFLHYLTIVIASSISKHSSLKFIQDIYKYLNKKLYAVLNNVHKTRKRECVICGLHFLPCKESYITPDRNVILLLPFPRGQWTVIMWDAV